jgi:hypothetical protein
MTRTSPQLGARMHSDAGCLSQELVKAHCRRCWPTQQKTHLGCGATRTPITSSAQHHYQPERSRTSHA